MTGAQEIYGAKYPMSSSNDRLSEEILLLRQRLAEYEARHKEDQARITALEESERNIRVLLDESSDPTFSFLPDGTYRYVNQAFASGVGKDLDQIIGKRIWDVFPLEEAEKRFAVVKWVYEHGETRIIEVRVPRPDGDRFYITTAKPIMDEQGKVTSVICTSKEITERKRMEDELRQISTHDALTGLYNRHFFELEINKLQEGGYFPVGLVLADLDGLKETNDRLGHEAGDELLRRAATLLGQVFRVKDRIARIGGDEFAVILPETNETAMEPIVSRLRNHLNNTFPRFNMSIGTATANPSSVLHEVLRLADARMYQDKRRHKEEK